MFVLAMMCWDKCYAGGKVWSDLGDCLLKADILRRGMVRFEWGSYGFLGNC